MGITHHPASQSRLLDCFTGFIIVVGMAVLYGLCSPVGLVSGDGAELAYGMKYLTTVHPPGYPLYLVLGHWFVEVTGLNYLSGPHLLSALFVALSLGGIYWFLRRRSMSSLSSFLVVVGIGFSAMIWSIGIQTEVYSLALLFLVGTLLGWDYVCTHGVGHYFLWFWVGLSLTHHPTGVINLLFAVHATSGQTDNVSVLRAGLLFVLPGSLYLTLLLPGSGMPLQWPEISTLNGLVTHMLGGSFARFFLSDGIMTPFIQLKRTAVSHFAVFPYLLLIPLFMGYVTLRGRERFIVWVQIGFVFFLLFYGVPDIKDFLVPSYLFSGIVLGRGLQSIGDYFQQWVYVVLVLLGIGSIVVFSFQIDFQYDRSEHDFYQSYAERLDSELKRGTFVTDWARFTPIRYHKLDQNILDHVQLVTLPLNYDLASLINDHERRGIPVYTNLPAAWSLPPSYKMKRIETTKVEIYQITK